MKFDKFKYFKDQCLCYQKKYGLLAWYLYFVERELEKDNAVIEYNEKGYATIVFDKRKLKTKEMVRQTAKHEITHLINAHLHILACKRFLNEEQIDNEDEKIALRLEKLLPD
jgi:hypothetical protein